MVNERMWYNVLNLSSVCEAFAFLSVVIFFIVVVIIWGHLIKTIFISFALNNIFSVLKTQLSLIIKR